CSRGDPCGCAIGWARAASDRNGWCGTARRSPSRASRTRTARGARGSRSTRSRRRAATAATSSSSSSADAVAEAGEPLDDLRDVSAWRAIGSGAARLALAGDEGPGGGALRLDFDFAGGGGFVVARRELARALPEAWALSLRVRGAAPANRLEIKLVDPSGRNVWWWRRDAFAPPADWQALRLRSSDFAFAWGPAGGGAIRALGALEIAVVAPPGGRGVLAIADLRLEDLSLAAPPRVTASSGAAPERVVEAAGEGWRSGPGRGPQWLALDFGRAHEVGGLVVDWGAEGAARAFAVESSDDGASWEERASARRAEGLRSYVYLPGGARARHLRLVLREPAAGAAGFAIRRLAWRPYDFGRSLADFFAAV